MSCLLVVSLLGIFFAITGGTHCQPPWVGPSCQYLCHCQSQRCDKRTGGCQSGVGCDGGWFGPLCQYLDAMNWSTGAESWLSDSDDETCNDNDTSATEFKISFQFQWALLVFRHDNVLLSDLQLDFHSSRNRHSWCEQLTILRAGDRQAELHCSGAEMISSMGVSGRAVRDLCSLYLSAGMNLALKQPTAQSSTQGHSRRNHGPELAVDGDNRMSFTQNQGCAMTKADHKGAHFNLTFSGSPVLIHHIVLYNIDNAERVWDTEFKVELYNEKQELVSKSQQRARIPLHVYQMSLYESRPVRTLILRASVNYQHSLYRLVVCEIEVFGQALCPPGYGGLHCQSKCDHCQNSLCAQSTGTCLSCPPGRKGGQCTEVCEQGTHGVMCSRKCPVTCATCDPVSGNCTTCPPGHSGQFCLQDCPRGYFGKGCQERCSAACFLADCHTLSGACLRCLPGYTGAFCLKECAMGRYGFECSQTCSSECPNRSCDVSTGQCLTCPAGHFGMACSQVCPFGVYGKNCSSTCSDKCMGGYCDPVTGICPQCKPGYLGKFCNQACGRHSYGLDCANDCSINCLDMTCKNTDGSCLACTEGFLLPQCIDPAPDPYTTVGYIYLFAPLVTMIMLAIGLCYQGLRMEG